MSEKINEIRDQVAAEISITWHSQRLYQPSILKKLREIYPEKKRCPYLNIAQPGHIPLASCGLAERIEVTEQGIQALEECPEIHSGRATRRCLLQNS